MLISHKISSEWANNLCRVGGMFAYEDNQGLVDRYFYKIAENSRKLCKHLRVGIYAHC